MDVKHEGRNSQSSGSPAIESPESSKRNSNEITDTGVPVDSDGILRPTIGEDSSESASADATTGNGTNDNLNQDNNQSTHIAFAEHQDPSKKRTGVLRIPSPREFERGKILSGVYIDHLG